MSQTVLEPMKNITSKISHCVCAKCYPNYRPGDIVTTLCGIEKAVNARRQPPPTNACVVCLDLWASHHRSHA